MKELHAKRIENMGELYKMIDNVAHMLGEFDRLGIRPKIKTIPPMEVMRYMVDHRDQQTRLHMRLDALASEYLIDPDPKTCEEMCELLRRRAYNEITYKTNTALQPCGDVIDTDQLTRELIKWVESKQYTTRSVYSFTQEVR